MDIELHANLLRKVLKPQDQLINKQTGEEVVYLEHPLAWYGRLGNPGTAPGLYIDRYKIRVDTACGIVDLPVKDLEFKNLDTLSSRKKQLGDEWFEINFQTDFINKLPTTLYIESDVVFLTDPTHPNYVASKDLIDPDTGENKGPIPLHQLNQYTVYRINYDNSFAWDASSKKFYSKLARPSYRLRARQLQFDATEDQCQLLSRGPVKIFNSALEQSESFDLPWRSLKDEAEFYLLLGRFTRIFNKNQTSYLWSLVEARSSILNGLGDAIYKNLEGYWLVKFWDQNIGDQIRCELDLILDT